MLHSIWHWLATHEALLIGLGVGSIVLFVVTLVAMPLLVAWIPADYFVRRRRPRLLETGHFLFWLLWRIAKNAAAVILILMGIAMLVLPGQGILTILVGLVLLDFPRKRALERWLVCLPRVRRAANWIRRKAGRPPLVLDQRPEGCGGEGARDDDRNR
jgi:hypothetical protein